MELVEGIFINAKGNRFMELEGLRGLAALAVVFGHLLYAFYPALMTGNLQLQHMRFEDDIYGTPLAVLFAGTFAVAIFFVLSGFVLTIGFFQTKRADIIKKLATKRYLRLMLPALASIFLCLVLIKSGLDNIDGAAAITQSKWLGGAWQFDANVIDAFIHGTVGIFTEGSSPYNNVLWTMTTEFLGSFLVFGFVSLFAQSAYRWVGYAALGVLTFNTWFLAFVIGMVLADAYSMGMIQRLKNRYVLGALLAGGLFLGAYPHKVANTFYEFIQPNFMIGSVNILILYLTLGATMVVLTVIASRRLANILRMPMVSILGKYTFSLYLVHLSVLYVFATNVFVKLQPLMGYNKAVILTLLLFVPVVWVMTKLFEKYVDAPSVALAKRVADIYEGKEALDLRQRFVAVKENLQFRWIILQSRISSVFRPTEDPSE